MRGAKCSQAENILNMETHGSLCPVELRPNSGVTCTIAEFDTAIVAWNISPVGMVFGSSVECRELEPGQQVLLSLQVRSQHVSLHCVVCGSAATMSGKRLFGVRFSESLEIANPVGSQPRRLVKEWGCAGGYLSPTLTFADLVRFGAVKIARVDRISSQGLRLAIARQDLSLIPEYEMDGHLHLPTVGTEEICWKLKRCLVVPEGELLLEVGLVHPNQTLIESLGQYALRHSDGVSLLSLVKSGLTVHNASKCFTYDSVKDEDDYREVISLRERTYGATAKHSDGSVYESPFDAKSRIVVARHRGQIIASARLMFFESESEPLEHDQYLSHYPVTFPAKTDLCEIMRVCVHHSFRGSDTLIGFFRHILVAVVEAQKRYIVGCSTSQLLPLYETLGFKNTGTTFRLTDLNDTEHHLILYDIKEVSLGRGVHPDLWDDLYKDVLSHLVQMGMLSSL